MVFGAILYSNSKFISILQFAFLYETTNILFLVLFILGKFLKHFNVLNEKGKVPVRASIRDSKRI